jgi:hypothetical protein
MSRGSRAPLETASFCPIWGSLCLRSRTTVVQLRSKDLRPCLVSEDYSETIVSPVSFPSLREGLRMT